MTSLCLCVSRLLVLLLPMLIVGCTHRAMLRGGGESAVLEYLQKSGTAINPPYSGSYIAVYFNGITFLHQAASDGHKAVVDYLIKQGVNVNLRAEYNATPLHFSLLGDLKGNNFSIGDKKEAIAAELLANGADPNVAITGWPSNIVGERFYPFGFTGTEENGVTPLMLAAGNGALSTLKLLKERGADFEATTAREGGTGGWTALHFALLYSKWEVAKWLVQNGAKPSMVSPCVSAHGTFVSGTIEFVSVSGAAACLASGLSFLVVGDVLISGGRLEEARRHLNAATPYLEEAERVASLGMSLDATNSSFRKHREYHLFNFIGKLSSGAVGALKQASKCPTSDLSMDSNILVRKCLTEAISPVFGK